MPVFLHTATLCPRCTPAGTVTSGEHRSNCWRATGGDYCDLAVRSLYCSNGAGHSDACWVDVLRALMDWQVTDVSSLSCSIFGICTQTFSHLYICTFPYVWKLSVDAKFIPSGTSNAHIKHRRAVKVRWLHNHNLIFVGVGGSYSRIVLCSSPRGFFSNWNWFVMFSFTLYVFCTSDFYFSVVLNALFPFPIPLSPPGPIPL